MLGEITHQRNSVDCGVFLVAAADELSSRSREDRARPVVVADAMALRLQLARVLAAGRLVTN